jgi:hypothetical protein
MHFLVNVNVNDLYNIFYIYLAFFFAVVYINKDNIHKSFFLVKKIETCKIDKKEREDNQQKIEPKYEEKYLNKFNLYKDEMTFTKEDLELEEKMYLQLKDNKPDESESENRKEAHEYVIKDRIEKLKNTFVIEKTPLGNVMMSYNNIKNSFEYYSDNTIPYRYLETVARKYVIYFDCKMLYVDMNVELKNAMNNIEKRKDNDIKEEKSTKTKDLFKEYSNQNRTINNSNSNSNSNSNNNPIRNCKPNPFMNKNTNTNVKNNRSTEKCILKENANRYTHNGKYSNINLLKKVDRKIVDKNYALSYKDFKKIM